MRPSSTAGRVRQLRLAGVMAAVLLAAFAGDAAAQYFGRNQVQYDRFDFKVLRTERFDIYYYEEAEEAVQLAARLAERWYARLSQVLGHQLSSRQPLILYASHPHFRQTNAIGSEPGEGTGGVTESFKRRVVMPFAAGLAETDHVLGHEIVHAFQFDMSTAQGGRPMALALPLWFVEGMAEYLSLGPTSAHTAMWMRDAVARDALPRIRQLGDRRYFPYRYGHAFWAYVAGRWGDEVVGRLLREAPRAGSLDELFEGILGVNEETLSADWHESLRRAYAAVLDTSRPAEDFGRPLITSTERSRLNLAPSLSPDGQRLVFLSERGLFSIDMFLADATTGEVIRRLVRTATDPHFDSLQFLSSAGTWSPSGDRFLFSAIVRGRPVLTTIDATTGRTTREIRLGGLDEVFNPAWSPDGRRIAFSGMAGGLLDLYVLDLESEAIERLTHDPFAELAPAWSPDGTRLVFSTDRFSSDLDSLSFGDHRLAVVDVATRAVEALPGFAAGRHTTPRWMPDGRQIVFVADPDGVANVYRLDLSTRETVALTNVQSGVSGITASSPALTVASSTGRVAFSAFRGDGYDILTLDEPATTTAATEAPRPDRRAAALTYERAETESARLLAQPLKGLPTQLRSEVEPYRAALSLDFVTQPTIGVGVDRFGAYAQGGIAFLFSDMLGDHQLVTVAQLNGELDQLGGAAMYVNRRHRWNWGVVGEMTPYVTGAFGSGLRVDEGGLVFVEEQLRIRETNLGLSGLTQYPFSRASRLELTGGVRRISFSRQLRTNRFDPATGRFLSEDRIDLPAPDPLSFAEVSGAFVHDTSLFGLVGPIMGQRHRLEVSQLTGSLNFTGLLADTRAYAMPVRPFTIAGRALHYGRYGSGGEDPRLSPLFLGYPHLVRGYGVGSFRAGECGQQAGGGCPVFDQLLGSRMLVGNLELRFPLVGLVNRDQHYGWLPIEMALFADAGVAWTSGEAPSFAGGPREWVRSAGVALRANLFGFAVVEIDYVRPLDRPGRGWLWQFGFTPAF